MKLRQVRANTVKPEESFLYALKSSISDRVDLIEELEALIRATERSVERKKESGQRQGSIVRRKTLEEQEFNAKKLEKLKQMNELRKLRNQILTKADVAKIIKQFEFTQEQAEIMNSQILAQEGPQGNRIVTLLNESLRDSMMSQ